MLFQSAARTLPKVLQSSGTPIVPGGTFGEPLCAGLNPKYYSLVKAGKVFTVASTGISSVFPTYAGVAGTAPIVGVYNPWNSGVDVVILQTRVFFPNIYGNASTPATGLAYYAGPSNGSPISFANPVWGYNNYTLLRGGYQAVPHNAGFSGLNALPWATAMVGPLLSLGSLPSSPGAPMPGNWVDEPNGQIVGPPGSYVGIGNNALSNYSGTIPTIMVTWAEIPA